jgi:putative Holliday junction resolvase
LPAPSTRVLALDTGDRRIGIAISDESRTLAVPLPTLTRSNRRNDLRYFDRLMHRTPFAEIVVGLPLYPSGDRSPQAEKAQSFGEMLAAHLSVPVHFWDERLTSAEAHRYLAEAGHAPSSLRGKGKIDQVAAVLILESWLAAQQTKQRTDRGC